MAESKFALLNAYKKHSGVIAYLQLKKDAKKFHEDCDKINKKIDEMRARFKAERPDLYK